jgi:AcrR family transcriptional regulator
MNGSFNNLAMARPRPPGRLDALARAALELFSQRGYRRTQMADVARRVGVSPGSLYAYVASKEALFELAVLRAFGEAPRAKRLPLRTPFKNRLARHVQARLGRDLRRARVADLASRPAPTDVAAEVRAVVGELYDGLVANAAVLRLLDRTAPDRPELGELYYGRLRVELLDRVRGWIARRVAEGALPPVPDETIAARLLLETAAWFAWHRHGDPAPQAMDDALARETVVELLARGLLSRGTTR